MSVLIKGMEMPKNCAECEFHQSGYPDWCDLSIRARDIHNTEIRQEWCPLVEVPTPHGRLIDADIVCYQLEKQATIDGQPRAIRRARKIVADAPTIIEAEKE